MQILHSNCSQMLALNISAVAIARIMSRTGNAKESIHLHGSIIQKHHVYKDQCGTQFYEYILYMYIA